MEIALNILKTVLWSNRVLFFCVTHTILSDANLFRFLLNKPFSIFLYLCLWIYWQAIFKTMLISLFQKSYVPGENPIVCLSSHWNSTHSCFYFSKAVQHFNSICSFAMFFFLYISYVHGCAVLIVLLFLLLLLLMVKIYSQINVLAGKKDSH